MNKVLVVILTIVGTLVVLGVIGSQLDTYEPSPQAVDNTNRNIFISACMGEGASRSACVCAIDSLVELYPDFLWDEARLNRINEVGYYQNETDAMLPCVGI